MQKEQYAADKTTTEQIIGGEYTLGNQCSPRGFSFNFL